VSHGLTRKQVRDLDRRALEDYGIPGIVLMENAGLNLCAEVLDFVKASGAKDKAIAIVCGRGNNGGDGFVLARHLTLANACPAIFFIDAKNKGPATKDCLTNYQIASRMAIPICQIQSASQLFSELQKLEPSALCDAYLGTGLETPLRPFAITIIEAINRFHGSIIAVDIPSGLDCDTGRPLGASVKAVHTITMAAMKRGFELEAAKEFVGTVEVIPIGAPAALLPPQSPRSPKRIGSL
jgi:NAD(P)H-hydrate epimerase